LSRQDLRAFVTGEDHAPALKRLRSAELSKHKILLAAIMRAAARMMPGDYERTLAIPYRLLAGVEARAPAVVRDLLASPQFGAWADDCARRLLNPADHSRDAVPPQTGLGHLAVFAATAALRAGQAFELDLPLRDGAVTFPALGTARPGASTPWEWGRACLEGERGQLRSSVGTVRIPSARDEPENTDGAWSDLPRIVIDSGGQRLDVVLDSADPYLDRYGIIRAPVGDDDLVTWQELLTRAWVILTRDHCSLAPVIAGTVRTLVPMVAPSPTRPVSSTDIACFGAVALSLPADALSMAETLVHESHHALLGGIMDLLPLIGVGRDFLAYAPWRDDPRPCGALLQGIFAHYGMGRFWHRQRGIGPPPQRLRGTAEFARLRMVTTQAADVLARSGVLTEAGHDFLAVVRGELAAWHDEQLPVSAVGSVEDLSAEHRVRWRLRHLVPDPVAIDTLIRAWRGGGSPPVPPTSVSVMLEPGPLPRAAENTRSYLLSLRYRDPERLQRWITDGGPGPGESSAPWRLDPADVALVRGQYDVAAAGYLRRISAGDDHDAWAGLAVIRRHTGPAGAARLLTERPEVVVALYDRLRGSLRPDPDELVSWLAVLR
jgi:HEXXH motif-containing protein